MRGWNRVLDGILVLVAFFRVVVAYSVDVAMTFRYPMALDGCAAACSGALCAFNCRVRALLHLDMAAYVASGVDPASAALGPFIRLMTGFYFVVVAPFMVLLVYALWARKEEIRTPAIVVAATMGIFMVALTARNAFGTPASTNIGLFLLYNLVDVVAPVLILIRVVPRPLFAPNGTEGKLATR